MKTFKIILGLLVTYGAGKEYVNASRSLFSFFDPGIVVGALLMLLLGPGCWVAEFPKND